MRFCVQLMAAVGLMAAACFSFAQTAATRPAAGETGVIHGHVSITTGMFSQAADLTRVAVYLASSPAVDAASAPATRATVAQYRKAFVPDFLIVPRDTNVEFPNWDHISHNVFSISAAAPAFDLDRYPYGQSKTRTFQKLGVVQLFCNIHPQMRGVIYVTPNRFSARPDADGQFTIAGVPAGAVQVEAWSETCQAVRRAAVLKAGGTVDVDFNLAQGHGEAAASEAPADNTAYDGVTRGLGVKRQRLSLPVVTDTHPAAEDSHPQGD